MAAYYNENDPFAVAWLRELIKTGLIADGEVDERSIEAVAADDVRGFVQCHFFAGIGGWSYALRLAGWPDDRAVWTGSCPCQPFSSAGAQAGGSDARDLWPTWFRLVRECHPVVVFGEQVDSAIGHGWLDRLCDDLEREGYAVGPCSLPAASSGAFHRRQRVWFVADSQICGQRRPNTSWGNEGAGEKGAGLRFEHHRSGCMADTDKPDASQSELQRSGRLLQSAEDASAGVRLAVSDERGCEVAHLSIRPEGQNKAAAIERRASYWSPIAWIPCADGKARPIEPGLEPLAHGLPARVGRLRGYGNAIVPQTAQVFIEAYMSITKESECGA